LRSEFEENLKKNDYFLKDFLGRKKFICNNELEFGNQLAAGKSEKKIAPVDILMAPNVECCHKFNCYIFPENIYED